MGIILQSARFHLTVAKRNQIPPASVPEIAFAGRSNSGKSSAINRLCQRKRLAFASKTPGRTQALNYFALGPDGQAPEGFLVDTPGYGYASVPLEVKHDWQGLAGWYLRERRTLAGVVLMLDCRRLLTPMDADLLGWVPPDVPRLILITKADKLKRQAQRKTLTQIQDQYLQIQPRAAATFLLFSSVSGQGVDEARAQIGEWLESGPRLEGAQPGVKAVDSGDADPVTTHASQRRRPEKPGSKATAGRPGNKDQKSSGARVGPRKAKHGQNSDKPVDDSTRRQRRPKKNPMKGSPGSKPVNRGARSGRRSGR